MTEDEKLFRDHFPQFTEVSSVEAKSFYDSHGEFVSADGKRVGVDSFAVQFMTRFQKHGPFVMNGKTARALCDLLIQNDFGPEEEPPPAGELG